MPGDLYIITAAGDHSVILWDMHESDIREVSRFDAHTRSVKTAVFRQEDNGKLNKRKKCNSKCITFYCCNCDFCYLYDIFIKLSVKTYVIILTNVENVCITDL